MIESRDVFFARNPTLHDVRGGRHLLVWGELAQWLVVDEELYDLLGRFDGTRPIDQVLGQQAKRFGKSRESVHREAGPVLQDLLRRDILTARDEPPPLIQESLSIANVTINLTNRCNLRCPFCYNDARTTREMEIGSLMTAIDGGRPIFEKAASFIILGGEPLIDPERLYFALDRAGSLFEPSPLVSTNGTMLGKRAVRELARRRVEVQVSLDSHLPEIHDALRGRGVFKKALTGTRRLVDSGVHTILSMVYTKENLNGLEPYLDLALQLGVQEARFIPLRRIGGGQGAEHSSPDQFAMFTHLLDVMGRRPEFRKLLVRDFFSILLAVCRQSTRRTSCGIGRRVVFIDADGAIYPCPNHVKPEFRAGSLENENLEEIVRNSPTFQDIRQRYCVTSYHQCKSCPFRHWCAGDCRGEVLAVTGDPAAPSPHCEELRTMYTEMLWLIAAGDTRLGAASGDSEGRSAGEAFL